MSDALAEVQTFTEKTLQPTLVVDLNTLNQGGRIVPETARSLLEAEMSRENPGTSLKRIGGSASREAFLSPSSNEVLLITNTLNPVILNQIKTQTDYYEKHQHDPAFTETVAPITRIIQAQQDGSRVIIGMGQKYIDTSLADLKTKLSGNMAYAGQLISDLTERYSRLIAQSGVSHGDLIHGRLNNKWTVEWDNIRFDSKTGKLYLVDYNGKNNSPSHGLTDNDVKNEPVYLNQALRQFFGLKAAA